MRPNRLPSGSSKKISTPKDTGTRKRLGRNQIPTRAQDLTTARTQMAQAYERLNEIFQRLESSGVILPYQKSHHGSSLDHGTLAGVVGSRVNPKKYPELVFSGSAGGIHRLHHLMQDRFSNNPNETLRSINKRVLLAHKWIAAIEEAFPTVRPTPVRFFEWLRKVPAQLWTSITGSGPDAKMVASEI